MASSSDDNLQSTIDKHLVENGLAHCVGELMAVRRSMAIDDGREIRLNGRSIHSGANSEKVTNGIVLCFRCYDQKGGSDGKGVLLKLAHKSSVDWSYKFQTVLDHAKKHDTNGDYAHIKNVLAKRHAKRKRDIDGDSDDDNPDDEETHNPTRRVATFVPASMLDRQGNLLADPRRRSISAADINHAGDAQPSSANSNADTGNNMAAGGNNMAAEASGDDDMGDE